MMAEAQATAGAEARAAYDARAKVVDESTERLKALRLARDAVDAQMSNMNAPAEEKARRRKALTDEPAVVAKALRKRKARGIVG